MYVCRFILNVLNTFRANLKFRCAPGKWDPDPPPYANNKLARSWLDWDLTCGCTVPHAVGGLPDSGALFVRCGARLGTWLVPMGPAGPGGGPTGGAPSRGTEAGRSTCVCGGWSRRRRGEHGTRRAKVKELQCVISSYSGRLVLPFRLLIRVIRDPCCGFSGFSASHGGESAGDAPRGISVLGKTESELINCVLANGLDELSKWIKRTSKHTMALDEKIRAELIYQPARRKPAGNGSKLVNKLKVSKQLKCRKEQNKISCRQKEAQMQNCSRISVLGKTESELINCVLANGLDELSKWIKRTSKHTMALDEKIRAELMGKQKAAIKEVATSRETSSKKRPAEYDEQAGLEQLKGS
ncbi:hypothetical protein F511_36582 [Dorcoceras hygrometricum]|uniref:Uncharacterized protein n=1 Tax=Dorcoceras hygrometricum TaxID=472368 RepID=A0A2Z7A3T7_9LAMI|nr:hypothetical protein F511_36582 [Dorcoceras hygrometricum]